VLPAAFLEGQRIRNGMVGIIKLFLVRVLSVALVILGAAFLDQPFPVTPRHTALIAMLTVGIPALGLAAWAKPRRTQTRLLPLVAGFVLPASVCLGLAGLLLYRGYMAETDDVERARSVLTSLCCLCGIMLIPFAVHGTRDWLSLQALRADRQTAGLAVAMLAGFVLIWLVSPLRDFYELKPMPVQDWAIVLTITVAWAGLLKLVWDRIDENFAIRRKDAAPAPSGPA
jgi:cation-transporting ATPase E